MSTPNSLQPSHLLTISSILVIAGCVLIAGNLFAGVLSKHALEIVAGFLFLPIPLFFIFLQYRGTFHQQPRSAHLAGKMSLILGVLLCLVIGTGILESLASWNWTAVLLILTDGLPILLFGGFLIIHARLSFNWAKFLRGIYADTETNPPTLRFSVGEAMGTMTLLCLIAGLGAFYSRNELPRYAEHVAADKAPMSLPGNASDISYSQGYRGTSAFEFTTDEESFRNWVESGIGSIEAQSSGVTLEEISQPTGIRRYEDFHNVTPWLDNFQVTHGIEYYWSKEDRHVHAIFDRDTKRAYYSEAYH